MKRLLNIVKFTMLGTVTAVALVACGGGGGGGGGGSTPPPTQNKTVAGNAVKGTVSGGTIKFYVVKSDGTKDTSLGSATTDANGNFKVSFATAPTYPILAEATGGSYVDEVTGATITLAPSDSLTALLCAETTQASITPLTHMAATRARALAATGTPIATACTSSNIGTAQQFMIGDIIKTLAISANNPTQVLTATTEQRAYGIVMAGIVQEAQTLGVRAFDLVNALATDMTDGIMDGKNGSNSITIPKISGGTIPLTASMGTTDLQAAINQFIASTNNKTNLSTKSISPQLVQVGSNVAGAFYPTLTALPAFVSGTSMNVPITATGGTPPYICGVKSGALPAGFTLGDNCLLIAAPVPTLPSGTSMRVSPPFTVNIHDSATPPASKDIYLNIITAQPAPTIAPVNGTCEVKKACNISVATASGGTPSYYFMSDTFVNGTPPLGTVVDLNGNLIGTPTTADTYKFGVCVVDSVGAKNCGTTSVTIKPAPTTPPPTTNICSQVVIACGQVKNGIEITGAAIPGSCACPSGTTLAGKDNVSPGGPYNICSCN
jgi:hypothetical protein